MSVFSRRTPVIVFHVRIDSVPEFIHAMFPPELRAAAHHSATMAGAKSARIGRSRWTVQRTHHQDRGLRTSFTASVSDLSREAQRALLDASTGLADIVEQKPAVNR